MQYLLRLLIVITTVFFALRNVDSLLGSNKKKPLTIDNTYKVDAESCKMLSREHDTVFWTYRGYLNTGIIFDQGRYKATLGHHQVITGVDVGMRGMCVGDKRTLTIQPEWGYGARGFPGKIPANSVLNFDVELMGIVRPGGETAYINELRSKNTTGDSTLLRMLDKKVKVWRRAHPGF